MKIKAVYLFLFVFFFIPLLAQAGVVINEVAWMGTEVSATDEWIELKNTTPDSIDLEGWTIEWRDGLYNILISFANTDENKKCSNTIIPAGGYFLLERTDDETVPGIIADCFYTGALRNNPDGEHLILKNSGGALIDEVNGLGGWPAGDNGSNDTPKKTMQKSGIGWITADPTPKAENMGSSSNENFSSGEISPSEDSTTETQSSGSVSSTSENEPKITAKASAYAIMIAGSENIFSGNGYDLKGEPLSNAEYKWSFGDGSYKSGKNITHTYFLPGDYMVALNVVSGMYGASDYLKIKVISLPVYISEVKPGAGGFVEFYNDSKFNLDISRFGIFNSKSSFYFPENTIILAGKYLAISQSVIGFEIFKNYGSISFLYQNSEVADLITYSGELKENESFHKIEGLVKIGLSSPGSDSFLGAQKTVPVLAQNMDNSAGIKQNKTEEPESSSVISDVEKTPADKTQTAIVNEVPSKGDRIFFGSSWFWFSGAVILGILSAVGVVFLRRSKFLADP